MMNRDKHSKHDVGKSISGTIILAFVFVTLIPILFLLLYSYRSISKEIRDDFNVTYTAVAQGIDRNLDIYFAQLRNESLELFASSTLQNILLEDPSLTNLTLDSIRFREEADNIYKYRTDIGSIKIYGQKSQRYISTIVENIANETPTDDEIIQKLQNGDGRFQILGVRLSSNDLTNNLKAFSVGRVLKNLRDGSTIGYLIVDLKYRNFAGVIGQSQTLEHGAILITLPDGTAIYNSSDHNNILIPYAQTDAYQNSQFSRENSAPLLLKSSYFDWSYVIIPDNTLISDRMSGMSKLYVIIGLIASAVLMVLAVAIARMISKPLERLEEAMSSARDRQYNEIVPTTDSFREVNRLAMYYNTMQVEIQSHVEKERELVLAQKDAEFKALQTQIAPHFLYNSLDSINCMAQIHGMQDISRMILSLAKIFQYNMQYTSNVVTFQDELNHVRNYFTLQAINYQDRFRIEYQIPPECLSHSVVKFMLQPLVENAIHHGVHQKKSDGLILIEASMDDSVLTVNIQDNGSGMKADDLAEITKMLSASSDELLLQQTKTRKIGILNVNLRLKLLFGETAGISVISAEGVGTTFTLHIPERP
ncbi:MAG TPA: sensor histidine kinase [Candidatus Limiplasma sp.]|nr:sensor histidine kinase [Candidatus Limiplasma sp.]